MELDDEDVFDSFGPYYLDNVNWNDEGHQKAIYASLVNGAYILQRDNKRHRNGENALAPRWWEFFDFKLLEKLYDEDDKSIFGAVYVVGPRCVIAFRGTMKGRELFQDIKLDLAIFTNKLNRKSRFKIAMKVVEEKVVEFGQGNVILVGHSLGAALGILVGKQMVIQKGIFLKAFLFNPPHTTAIMLLSENKFRRLKKVIRRTVTLFNIIGSIVVLPGEEDDEMFKKLSVWKPNLCVHKQDLICSEYQSYFSDMKKIWGRKAEMAHIAARVSAIHFWRKILRKKSDIPLHLLPSAKLTVINQAKGALDAHKLQQWWKPDLQFDSQEFSIYDH
ncbi:GDSL esterase/lipase At4g10955-like [Impatiens glandulifera]|uniref:GDSL esterase/lipase At4g10955-like n=1 Tax=Impatiens glandulifera TaxID=253017 RepID=UPI001FB0CD30|nr:GDSL esterase/lipase At4g10955-like [Impatiens glandulifera]